MEAGVINFAIYENGSEYFGMANVTFGGAANKQLTANGAGIAGDVNLPVPGHRDAMTLTITWTDVSESAYKLSDTRVHDLDLRVAHEGYDPVSGALTTPAFKHLVRVLPLSEDSGTIAPAAAQGVSQEFSVLARKDFIDGKLVREYDPINFKDVGADGVDRLAAVRSALGK